MHFVTNTAAVSTDAALDQTSDGDGDELNNPTPPMTWKR